MAIESLLRPLLTLEAFRKISTWAKIKQNKYIKDEFTIEKISDDFFSGNLNIGNIVSVSGFLSKNGLFHKPSSFIKTIGRGIKQVKPIFDPKTHQKIGFDKQSCSVRINYLQLPIQVIPPVEDFNVLFLYNQDIKDFCLEFDKDKEEKNKAGLYQEDFFKVKHIHKPIMVLVNNKYSHNYSEKNVKITGKICPIPKSVDNYFIDNASKTTRDLMYNYWRPFSAISELGFCIDCRVESEMELAVNKTVPIIKRKGSVYLEAHFNDITEETIKLIDTHFPEILGNVFDGKNLTINSYGSEKEVSFISLSGIDVVRNGNMYGFYAETELGNQIRVEETLKKLNLIFHRFKKHSFDIIGEKENKVADLQLDFIYDFNKKNLFDKLLVSKEVERIVEEKPELINTINWLQA